MRKQILPRTSLLIVLIMLIGAALACGGSDDPTPPPIPTTPPQSNSNPQPAQNSGSTGIRVVNNSYTDICYLYISPTSSDSWGEDLLGDEILNQGYEYNVSLAPGTYDMRAEDCDGTVVGERLEASVTANMVWEVVPVPAVDSGGSSGNSGSGSTTIYLVNNSSTDICYAYISPSTASEWGADWLGDDILYSGNTLAYSIQTGQYDFLAQDCDGNTVDEKYDFQITDETDWTFSGGSSSSSTGGQPSSGSGLSTLKVTNNSDQTVCYLFISPSSSSDWGGDWLGDQIMYSGHWWEVTLQTGYYDLLVTDCDQNPLADMYEVYIDGALEWEITTDYVNTPFTGDASGANSCGDGICDASEDVYNCELDCGWCGDGLCTVFENGGNCPGDCGSDSCGDGICDASEDVYSCEFDCGWCGDGLCTMFENGGNCPEDCGGDTGAYCGDLYCDVGEDIYNCESDCGWCGDGVCSEWEQGVCHDDCSS